MLVNRYRPIVLCANCLTLLRMASSIGVVEVLAILYCRGRAIDLAAVRIIEVSANAAVRAELLETSWTSHKVTTNVKIVIKGEHLVCGWPNVSRLLWQLYRRASVIV